MSEKENAFPSVAADREGLNVKDAFNIHEALEDVKGESPARRLLYKNPYLTAGSSGIFSLLKDKRDPLFAFDPLAFRLNIFENFSLDRVVLILPAPRFGDSPTVKKYWSYWDKMIRSGNPKINGANNLYSYSVMWNEDFCIQWGVKHGKEEHIRIDFNPNKANLNMLSAFFSAFDAKAFSLIRVNRLDVAVDYGVYINPLCWRCQKISSSKEYKYESKIKTLYFGASGSDIQIRIYDKAFEILNIEKFDLEHSLWRVEVQMRKGIKGIDFFLTNKELLFEFNPFERLEFYDSFPIDTKGQGAYSLFINCARAYGLPFALSDLNFHTRKSYLRRLSEDMRNPPFNPPSLIYSNCIRPVFNAFSSRLRELFFYGRENGLEVPEN